MMYLNTTPTAPKAPCLRDYAELMKLLKPAAEILKAVPMKHVRRYLSEIVAEKPHLTEEAPIVVEAERKRRLRYSRPLRIARE